MRQRAESVRKLVWEVAAQVLRSDTDVALDRRVWSGDRRRWVVGRAQSFGAAVARSLAGPEMGLLLSRQVLAAEDDGKVQLVGVLGPGLGGVDHDPQVLPGDGEHVAVERDVADLRVGDRLVP